MTTGPKAAITELNERSREIFRTIVDAYVETGEPVGSRTLSRRLAAHLDEHPFALPRDGEVNLRHHELVAAQARVERLVVHGRDRPNRRS